MSDLAVQIESGRRGFRPGEEIRGTVTWSLEEDPASVELRLFWRTEGKGTQDLEVVATVPFGAPGRRDRRDFRIAAPASPYSFSGKLVSLIWTLEVVAEPGSHAGRHDVVVSLTGEPIELPSLED